MAHLISTIRLYARRVCTSLTQHRAPGFVPKSMLWPTVKPQEGQNIRVIFREVDQLAGRLILSQKQVFQAELLKSVNVGDVVEVRSGYDPGSKQTNEYAPVSTTRRSAAVALATSRCALVTIQVANKQKNTLQSARLAVQRP
jgi:hypothetical protein